MKAMHPAPTCCVISLQECVAPCPGIAIDFRGSRTLWSNIKIAEPLRIVFGASRRFPNSCSRPPFYSLWNSTRPALKCAAKAFSTSQGLQAVAASRERKEALKQDDENEDSNWWDEYEEQVDNEARGPTAAEDAMEMLEWPRICHGVAAFASTSLGRIWAGQLQVPSTMEGSQQLLAETHAAQEIESRLGGSLDFGGAQTSGVVEAMKQARKGMTLEGMQALAIAQLLRAGGGLKRSIMEAMSNEKDAGKALFMPLAELVRPITTLPEVVRSIQAVIDEAGEVMESASPELRKARSQQRIARIRLQELMARLGRVGGGQGGAGDDSVASLAGRMCVLVAASARSSVPGLVLQSAPGGTMLYVEPAAAVPLNNRLAEANAEVAKAEQAVLQALTAKLRDHFDDITFVANVISHLDVIVARARYSSWLGATRPTLLDPACTRRFWRVGMAQPRNDDVEQGATSGGMAAGAGNSEATGGGALQALEGAAGEDLLVELRGARHPLLLQQHRERLHRTKLRAQSKRKALARVRTRPGAGMQGAVSLAERACLEAETEVAVLEGQVPVAIDLVIRMQTRVVTITGPNTGGKTATIKTLGLAALMAKAGLYVLAAEPVAIPWFDAVLADIGDQQSLAQSLSTFSGHLARVQKIQEAASQASLVLLDEVGGGTDPTEGAALGMALLESLAQEGPGGALLTIATTHHGELKSLKYLDGRFENASVEFDELRLAPTFRLLWGIPGRSNAINIAQRLGLPADIIADARSSQGSATAEVNDVIMSMEVAKRQCEESLALAERLLRESESMHAELAAAEERLLQHQAALLLECSALVDEAASEARSSIGSILRQARQLATQVSPADSQSASQVWVAGKGRAEGRRRAKVEAAPVVETAVAVDSGRESQAGTKLPSDEPDTSQVIFPKVGDKVLVKKLGAGAEVTSVNVAKQEVTVKCGFMQIKLKLAEIQL